MHSEQKKSIKTSTTLWNCYKLYKDYITTKETLETISCQEISHFSQNFQDYRG